MNDQTDKLFKSNKVFKLLEDLAIFYDSLSNTTMYWTSQGTTSIINLDTYVFISIKETLNSIREILYKGRINDSYALLRKYYDSTVINVYTNLFLEDNFSIENFLVKEINDWLGGKKKLPEYRIMSQYIKKSPRLAPITKLLNKNNLYRDIRERCNDHTHYNFYYFNILNDGNLYFPERIKNLDQLHLDLENVFIQHFAYLFYLNDHYFMSSDYFDSMDANIKPEEGCENWVAPFIQDIFDEIVKNKRPDLAEEILKNSSMNIK